MHHANQALTERRFQALEEALAGKGLVPLT